MTVTYPPEFQRSVWSLRRIKSDPLAFLEGLDRCPDDVVGFSLAGRPAFLLKHPDLVESVLVTHHQKFVKAYGLQRATRLLGNGLLTSEGGHHRRRRAIVQPAFHRQQVERHGDTMVALAARAGDRWRQRKTVDSSEVSALTLAIVGRTLFGVDVDSLSAEVRDAVNVASDAIDPLISLLAPARRVRPERRRLVEVIDQLIARHERQRKDDGVALISLLLDSQARPGAITDELRDDALTILLAGHDTIASALVWTWILLAHHPEAEARLEEEVDAVLGSRLPTAMDVPALSFTRRVLAESLRLRPPAWVLARTARTDHQLGGVHIPAGSIVLISQHLLHRDSRFFPDPTAFNPDRWLDESQAARRRMAYLPFGAGPRACIGEGFAWMEGVLLLATFARGLRFRLEGDAASISPRPRITLRPPPLTFAVEPRRTRLGEPL